MKIFTDANICLDLLDSKRHNANKTIDFYVSCRDKMDLEFYFSGDFITTFYYILTEKKKIDAQAVVEAIEALSMEITPHYLTHPDFINAKNYFYDKVFDDFEDLMVLESASREGCSIFVTSDKKLLDLGRYQSMAILLPEEIDFES